MEKIILGIFATIGAIFFSAAILIGIRWCVRRWSSRMSPESDATKNVVLHIIRCVEHLESLTFSVAELSDKIKPITGFLGTIEAHGRSVSNGIGCFREDLKSAIFSDSLALRVDVLESAILSIGKDLHALVDPISELVVQQRNLLRQMTGTGGTQDDEILERAMILKQQYSLSLPDAIERATEMLAYSKGNR